MTRDNQSNLPEQSLYQAYMVRFVRSNSAENWRASLEDPNTGTTIRFADERTLLRFLEERLMLTPTIQLPPDCPTALHD